MEQFVFLPAFPGFNAREEERVLGPLFAARGAAVRFWNEPSRQRPTGHPFRDQGAFENAVEALVLFLAAIDRRVVVCFSGGAYLALALLQRQVRVERIVLVAPALPIAASLRLMLELAAGDFASTAPERAAELRRLLDAQPALFDAAMRRGVELALQDPQLLTHYWQNSTAMSRSFEALQQPGFQFDVESYFAVLDDLARHEPALLNPAAPSPVPVTICFGSKDPVANPSLSLPVIQRLFRNARVQTFETCGHPLHLEEPDAFVECVVAGGRTGGLSVLG